MPIADAFAPSPHGRFTASTAKSEGCDVVVKITPNFSFARMKRANDGADLYVSKETQRWW